MGRKRKRNKMEKLDDWAEGKHPDDADDDDGHGDAMAVSQPSTPYVAPSADMVQKTGGTRARRRKGPRPLDATAPGYHERRRRMVENTVYDRTAPEGGTVNASASYPNGGGGGGGGGGDRVSHRRRRVGTSKEKSKAQNISNMESKEHAHAFDVRGYEQEVTTYIAPLQHRMTRELEDVDRYMNLSEDQYLAQLREAAKRNDDAGHRAREHLRFVEAGYQAPAAPVHMHPDEFGRTPVHVNPNQFGRAAPPPPATAPMYYSNANVAMPPAHMMYPQPTAPRGQPVYNMGYPTAAAAAAPVATPQPHPTAAYPPMTYVNASRAPPPGPPRGPPTPAMYANTPGRAQFPPTPAPSPVMQYRQPGLPAAPTPMPPGMAGHINDGFRIPTNMGGRGPYH